MVVMESDSKPEDCPSTFDSLNLACSECIENCESRNKSRDRS
jgi:hypothetical protein